MPIPKVINDYEITRKIGEGGMGIVYQAVDRRSGLQVALKLLRDDIASNLEARRRFEREVRVLRDLKHPNILSAIDSGAVGGVPYFVMRYVEGENLYQRLDQRGPIPLEETNTILQEVARALTFAHQRDIIHRDVKPSNILVTRSGHTFVADFGIAADINPYADSTRASRLSGLGTEGYIAPEVRLGERAAPQTDVFSLGATLYEMLTGRRLDRARYEGNPWENLPSPIVDVIWQATQESPARRYASIAAMAAAFDQAVRVSRNQPRPAEASVPTRQMEAAVSGKRDTPSPGQVPAADQSVPAMPPAALLVMIGVVLLSMVLVLLLAGSGVGRAVDSDGTVNFAGASDALNTTLANIGPDTAAPVTLVTFTLTPILVPPNGTDNAPDTNPAAVVASAVAAARTADAAATTAAAPTVTPTTAAQWGAGRTLFVTEDTDVYVSAGGALSLNAVLLQGERVTTATNSEGFHVYRVAREDWYHVRSLANGTSGWVPARVLSTDQVESSGTVAAGDTEEEDPPADSQVEAAGGPGGASPPAGGQPPGPAQQFAADQVVYTWQPDTWLRETPGGSAVLGGPGSPGLISNSELTILGGPEAHGGQWWWQVRVNSGMSQTGWVEDGSLKPDPYVPPPSETPAPIPTNTYPPAD